MITEKKIIVPIFNYAAKIVVADTIEEASKKYDIDPNCKGALLEYEDKSILIVKPNVDNVVVHECVHLKNAIWNRIGYTPAPTNDEPDAYLVDYLYNQVCKVIQKHLAPKC